MKYDDGTTVVLGDIVQLSMPDGLSTARVVMLGDTKEHLAIDERFRTWAMEENLLRGDAVVVEWVGDNPLAHDDATLAPVGNYMFTTLIGCVPKRG